MPRELSTRKWSTRIPLIVWEDAIHNGVSFADIREELLRTTGDETAKVTVPDLVTAIRRAAMWEKGYVQARRGTHWTWLQKEEVRRLAASLEAEPE